jgi:hypothetical protein
VHSRTVTKIVTKTGVKRTKTEQIQKTEIIAIGRLAKGIWLNFVSDSNTAIWFFKTAGFKKRPAEGALPIG